MTPSVTEYHFFFLAHEAEENSSAPDPEATQVVRILRTLLHYLENGRLQVITLSIPEQFAASEARLDYRELSIGELPSRPGSFGEIVDLARSLGNMARPKWRHKYSWDRLQSCTLQPGANATTRLFIRAEEEAKDPGGLLIHGALAPLPGGGLVDSAVGRQLMRVTSGLLPAVHARRDLQLLSGSRAHIEIMNSEKGDTGLQPLIVFKATAG